MQRQKSKNFLDLVLADSMQENDNLELVSCKRIPQINNTENANKENSKIYKSFDLPFANGNLNYKATTNEEKREAVGNNHFTKFFSNFFSCFFK